MLSDSHEMEITEMTTRILLVDDHEFVRAGVRARLEQENEFAVVGEVEDGLAVLQAVLTLQPDVVVLDHSLPGLNGTDVARKISKTMPQVKIVMLSMHKDEAYVVHALSCGVHAYVTKGTDSEVLVTAINSVLQGKKYLSAPHDKKSIETYMKRAESGEFDILDTLTPREREVAQLIVEGNSSKNVGERLFISERTVETHRSHIKKKLGAKSTADVVRIIVRYRTDQD